MTPYQMGSLALGGLSLAGSFGGGGGYSRSKRLMRKQYQYATRYEPGLIAARLKGTVDGARAAGLHPLFAMGGGVPSGGPGVMPGQSETGGQQSQAALGFAELLLRLDEKRESTDQARQQAMNTAMRIIERKMTNDNLASQQLLDAEKQKARLHPLQELKPAEVSPHGKHREQNLTERGVWHKFRYGNQDIWLPIEEISELLENPLKIFGFAKSYHGNKNVDWEKIFYYHRHGNLKGFKSAGQYLREKKIARQKKYTEKQNRRNRIKATFRRVLRGGYD